MRVSISSSGLSSPTKTTASTFDDFNSNPNSSNIILPSAKQIIENLNKQSLLKSEQNKLSSNVIQSNSCYNFLKLKPECKSKKSTQSSSESEHNTSSGVCNAENSSKNEENENVNQNFSEEEDSSLSLVSSGFAKNGGASQFGSGTNLSQNFNSNNNISNKFSNILFASALLKAEKKRRIQQWIATLNQQNEN